MRFLVDNQLPVALARFLSAKGVVCRHVLHLDLAEASDAEIWKFAGDNEYVVIGKDDDFLYLASASLTKARLIWIRIGNCRTKALLEDFELL